MSTRGISTDHTPSWRQLAECQYVDPDVMFPDPSDKRGTREAQAICLACPVRQECLDEAMAAEGGRTLNSRHGVYGGLTPGQRVRLRDRIRNGRRPAAA